MAVDLFTGHVHFMRDDVLTAGRVPLTWQRRYSTALLKRRLTPLGPGWMVKYFSTLTRHGDGFEFLSPEGDSNLFLDPEGTLGRGRMLRNLGRFQELSAARGRFIVTQWDVESGEIERLAFGPDRTGALLLRSVEDVCGEALDLEWETPGRLTAVRQRREKRALVLRYDVAERLVGGLLDTGDGSLELFRYEYDDAGRLVADFDEAGFGSRYEYDDHGRLVREAAADGGVFFYRYDREGRCVRYSGLDRYDEKSLHFLPAIRATELVDSYGEKTIFHFLPTGQIVRRIDPLGGMSHFEYDEFGRITAETLPGGATTSYAYDEHGNRRTIRNAVGAVHEISYNDAHLPTTLIDPNGQRWLRTYDSSNRLLEMTDPLGATWYLRYDEDGNAVSIVNPSGARREQRFRDGIVVAATDWMGQWTQYSYDARGSIVEVRCPDGTATRYQYDRRGDLVQVFMPDGSTVQYAYDPGRNITRVTNGNGHSTTFVYGPCSRLLERISAIGGRLRFEWGTEPGYLRTVINEKDETYSFTVDALGRTVEEVAFDGQRTQFTYDANGYTASIVSGDGGTLTIQRDAIGQVLSKQATDGARISYVWDPAGQVIAAASSDIATTIERDAKGRITREIQGPHWVETTYDPVGNVVHTRSSLGHDVQSDFDGNRRLTRLRTATGSEAEFIRDVMGRETARELPGNLRLWMTYDAGGRLTGQRVARSRVDGAATAGTPGAARELVNRQYAYDRGGQATVVDDARWGSALYSYDPAQRLLQAVRTVGVSERFAYDETSNLTLIETLDGTASAVRLAYAPGNRIERKGDTTYEFDARGRLVQKTEEVAAEARRIWRYDWDGLDQLKSVTAPDDGVYRFEYDAFGRRVAVTTPERRIGFVWDREVLLHEFGGGRAKSWITDPDGFAPLAILEGGEMYSIVTDHLGTPREVMHPRGELSWAATYTSWGLVDELRAFDDRTDCPVRFPGQWSDGAIGLHYNYFRYYDPERGAFITPDPIGWEGGANLYLYGKNPINWSDPFGLTKTCYKGKDGQGYVIYAITNGKKPPKVLYVGITERGRFNERQKEHRDSGRLSGKRQMQEIDSAENYGQARGYEQAYIEHHGTLNTAGRDKDPKTHPGNRARSYDPARVEDKGDKRAQTFDQHCQDKTAELNP